MDSVEQKGSLSDLDILQIMELLPHRYPFLLIDKLVDLIPNESAVGIKNVTFNEPFFQGHFPGRPIMPGVLIIEAMAQTAACVVVQGMPKSDKRLVYFMSVENARFRKPVVPGDTLRLEMTVVKRRTNVAKMAGRATVDGVLVAEAEVMCKLEDKPDPAAAEAAS